MKIKQLGFLFILLVCSQISLIAQSNFGTVDKDCVFSVLTCTPGSELYSTFGHSAIRVSGEIDGEKTDYVYNYGTFDAFEDNFYMKFARGKLNYILSKESFPRFQYNYLKERRGVKDQILNLNQLQKQKLFDLLEENYLPENREYLYDFFFNNCSTKIRDILVEATDGNIEFKDLTDKKSTFRDRIQEYLGNQPWGDFGIDIALGLPCDRLVEYKEDMFLPDYLYDNLAEAEINGQPLVIKENDLLLSEESESKNSKHSVLIVCSIFCGFFLLLILFLFLKKKWLGFKIVSCTLYSSIGFLGLFVFLLWVATDHTTTARNLNILWAMPLNILLVIFWQKLNFRKIYLYVYLFILLILGIWNDNLGQNFHDAILPFILLMAGVSWLNIVSLRQNKATN